ncbi:hypothetical protein B0T09DRAFT_398098 [Sordaria sp. MPI-SDFR-AT-0083]|nr:hypothetical protein B0T09DRAFT_398098 [Sordaria sp. MPI-SDFR-AT-0083]
MSANPAQRPVQSQGVKKTGLNVVVTNRYKHRSTSLKLKGMGKKKSALALTLAILVGISYLGGIILGTYDIRLRVGYFGECLTVVNATTNGIKEEKEDPQIKCLFNMRSYDINDLEEELWEDFDFPPNSTALAAVEEAVKRMLPMVIQVQKNALLPALPVVATAFFFVSGVMLLVATTATSHKRRYKGSLLTAALFGAFAFGLTLTMAVGTQQATSSILWAVNGDDDGLNAGHGKVVVERGIVLTGFLSGFAFLVAFFYAMMGVWFVRRRQ